MNLQAAHIHPPTSPSQPPPPPPPPPPPSLLPLLRGGVWPVSHPVCHSPLPAHHHHSSSSFSPSTHPCLVLPPLPHPIPCHTHTHTHGCLVIGGQAARQTHLSALVTAVLGSLCSSTSDPCPPLVACPQGCAATLQPARLGRWWRSAWL